MKYLETVLTFVLLAAAATATARAAEPEEPLPVVEDTTRTDNIDGEAASGDLARLKESLAKWEQARQKCGGDYSYTVRFASAFGFGNVTTISVKGNKVVERKYEEFGRPEPVPVGEKPHVPKPKWIETGKALGSHKPEGAAPRTVDELYAEAKKVLEAKLPSSHRRLLGLNEQGLLSYCFTQDTRIADDAPAEGVRPFQLQLTVKE